MQHNLTQILKKGQQKIAMIKRAKMQHKMNCKKCIQSHPQKIVLVTLDYKISHLGIPVTSPHKCLDASEKPTLIDIKTIVLAIVIVACSSELIFLPKTARVVLPSGKEVQEHMGEFLQYPEGGHEARRPAAVTLENEHRTCSRSVQFYFQLSMLISVKFSPVSLNRNSASSVSCCLFCHQ